METALRHQCLIYDGAPSRNLLAFAAVMRQKLAHNYRCLYLNSRPMVAGIRSYLAAAGVDVAEEAAKGSLVLSTDQQSLKDGQFDVDRMIGSLEDAVLQALKDGYTALWASGDMTWEFGSSPDFSRLLEYELRLEELFHRQPALSGICQYHTDTLPRDATRRGLVVHPSIFINETLSLVNPHYLGRDAHAHQTAENHDLDSAIFRLCRQEMPGCSAPRASFEFEPDSADCVEGDPLPS
jgi:hypothetical protein